MVARKTKAATTRAPKIEPATQTVDETVTARSDAANEHVAQAVQVTQSQVEKTREQTLKSLGDFYAFNQQNFEAVVAAGDVCLKGAQEINSALLASAQKSIETNLSNAKAVFSAKSLTEAAEMQSGFARKAFDDAVAETVRISELTAKLANDAAKPLSERARKTVETIVKTAA